MYYQFNILRQTRLNAIDLVKELSVEDLNKIPEGFNNSIIWNFNHSIITMFILCYKNSGIEIPIDDDLVAKYKKGTRPEILIRKDEINYFINLAKVSVQNLEYHWDSGVFNDYNYYKTSYGVYLSSSDDAIIFNNLHESLHLGIMMSMKKVLLKA